MVAQILGAMCAAAVIYGNYRGAIDAFEGGSGVRTVPGYSQNATAGIFGTYPAEFMVRPHWNRTDIHSALLTPVLDQKRRVLVRDDRKCTADVHNLCLERRKPTQCASRNLS